MAAPGEASFGALLRRYREAAGLTQEELAEAAGLSADAVSVLERGVRRAPYRDTVQLLVRALALPEQDRTALEATVRRRRGPLRPGAPPPSAHASREPYAAGMAIPTPTAAHAHDGDGLSSAAQPLSQSRSAAGETRALTILSLNLTASATRSASLSPEDRADLLHATVQVVAQTIGIHGGQIIQVREEGVLALFGTPVAHENDAERAIVAALALRELGRGHGLTVTAGIDTGTVYLGAVGPASVPEVTAIGIAADLAARLRETAQEGQILVGPAAYRQTRQAFAFEPQTLTVKEHAGSQAAYAVVGELAHPEKARGIEGLRAGLVGRERELALLTEHLAALRGGRGQVVLVLGEAGVGKSRLIGELHAVALAMRDWRPPPLWLEGRCVDVGKTISYWPFLDILRTYFGWRTDEDERARGTRLIAGLEDLVHDGVLTAARGEEMLPLLGALLAASFGDDRDARLNHAGPEQIKHQTGLALRDLVVALAQRQPLILILEDLHWADSLSLDVLSVLLEAVALVPLFLVCVCRPVQGHKSRHLGVIAARKCPDHYAEVHVRDLSPAQSHRLVGELLPGEALPAALTEQILARAQGNPFFLEEVVRALIEAGVIYHDGRAWQARAGSTDVAVPENLQSVILSRVDRLDEEARHVLQSAAVIGCLFRRALVGHVVQQEAQLDRILGELEDHQLIYLERPLPEEEYSFQHVLTQETIYHGILRRRRAVLHRQVAEALEQLYGEMLEDYYEQLAHHYDQAGVVEKSVPYLLKAGEKARRAYLTGEAMACFQRVLQRLDGLSEEGAQARAWRLAACTGLGQVFFGGGNLADAEAHFRQALALGWDLRLPAADLARLHYWLGDVLFWQGQFVEMRRVGEAGLALLGEQAESVEAVALNDLLFLGHMNQGNSAGGWRFVQRNTEVIRRVPYAEELRSAYDDIVIMHLLSAKDVPEAVKWCHLFQQAATHHHDLRAVAEATARMAHPLMLTGDVQGAITVFRQAVETARKIGDAKAAGAWLGELGDYFLSLGDVQTAEECVAKGATLSESAGADIHVVPAMRRRGWLALCQGALDTAIACFEAASQRADVASLVSLGQAYLAWGERAEAARHFEEGLAACHNDDAMATVLHWLRPLPNALSGIEEASGRPARVRTLVQQLRHEHRGARDLPLLPCLQPIDAGHVPHERMHEEFARPLSAAWTWHDPFGDCSFSMHDDLQIHAANARDLVHVNLSAPRLLRPAPSGNFAAQTVCGPASAEQPAIGGLVLWQDKEHYLVLERGHWGAADIAFRGCLDNRDCFLGRGRLPAEHVSLRLERQGRQVRALCSADGAIWFTAGTVEFPAHEGEQLGLHAIGMIDRTIYHGAYPEGTAIRFASFAVWTAEVSPSESSSC